MPDWGAQLPTCGTTAAMPSTNAAGRRVSIFTAPVAESDTRTRRKRARLSAVLASSPAPAGNTVLQQYEQQWHPSDQPTQPHPTFLAAAATEDNCICLHHLWRWLPIRCAAADPILSCTDTNILQVQAVQLLCQACSVCLPAAAMHRSPVDMSCQTFQGNKQGNTPLSARRCLRVAQGSARGVVSKVHWYLGSCS